MSRRCARSYSSMSTKSSISITDCGLRLRRLINYCNATRDYMVPSVWGQVGHPHFHPTRWCVCRRGRKMRADFCTTPGRQARRPLRSTTIRRVLYSHVAWSGPTTVVSSSPAFFRLFFYIPISTNIDPTHHLLLDRPSDLHPSACEGHLEMSG